MTIAEKLRALREANGLNKAEAAKKIGVAAYQYGRWESGELTPYASSILKICRAFNVTIDWLCDSTRTDEIPNLKHEPDGKRQSKYLYKTAIGKHICTAPYCKWRQKCGKNVYFCPGAGCLMDTNYKSEQEEKLTIWLLKMFALLSNHDI
jgi:transcriptional regulator with XRE-family HTH domain